MTGCLMPYDPLRSQMKYVSELGGGRGAVTCHFLSPLASFPPWEPNCPSCGACAWQTSCPGPPCHSGKGGQDRGVQLSTWAEVLSSCTRVTSVEPPHGKNWSKRQVRLSTSEIALPSSSFSFFLKKQKTKKQIFLPRLVWCWGKVPRRHAGGPAPSQAGSWSRESGTGSGKELNPLA